MLGSGLAMVLQANWPLAALATVFVLVVIFLIPKWHGDTHVSKGILLSVGLRLNESARNTWLDDMSSYCLILTIPNTLVRLFRLATRRWSFAVILALGLGCRFCASRLLRCAFLGGHCEYKKIPLSACWKDYLGTWNAASIGP
jgi:hypothetical protein